MKYFVLFGLLFAFAGCAHAPIAVQASFGQALVISQDPALRITHVDGEKTANFFGYLFHGFAKQVQLTPGNHTMTLWYGDPNKSCRSGVVYKVQAEAGDIFQVMDKPVEFQQCDTATTWVEGTHRGTMRLDSSRYEPVSDKNQRIEQSSLFKWSPPQGNKWIIEYRNISGAALARTGSTREETYAIYIQTFDLPWFSSINEFIDYVKAGRQKDASDERFTTLEETVLPYTGRSDYCVSFRHRAEDHNPGARSLLKHESMMMDSDGYVCRLPGNNNKGIHFEYSQRVGKGREDSQLQQEAKNSFALLEF